VEFVKQEGAAEGEEEEGGEKDDEFKEGEGYNNAPVGTTDNRTRTTVRNLRIREDTAKYLRNLDVNSAYYDPKTRSMRENPYPDLDPSELLYAGDNVLRKSGDALEIGAVSTFVMAANDRGSEVNMLTDPSEAEHLFAEFKKKKELLKSTRQQEIFDKYGGREHLDVMPDTLRFAQSEDYVEYNELGEVIKGQEKAVPKTKYLEDVHEHGHSEVWGSFYTDGKWGYACCGNTLRQAFCTGSTGRMALDGPVKTITSGSMAPPSAPLSLPPPSPVSSTSVEHGGMPPPPQRSLQRRAADEGGAVAEDEDEAAGKSKFDSEKAKARAERRAAKLAKREAKKKAKEEKTVKKRKRLGDDEPETDETRQLKEALEEERKRRAHPTGDVETAAVKKSKSGYNIVKTDLVPSEQEMEAYHRMKRNPEDPMTQFDAE